jgi:hypothetical protein
MIYKQALAPYLVHHCGMNKMLCERELSTLGSLPLAMTCHQVYAETRQTVYKCFTIEVKIIHSASLSSNYAGVAPPYCPCFGAKETENSMGISEYMANVRSMASSSAKPTSRAKKNIALMASSRFQCRNIRVCFEETFDSEIYRWGQMLERHDAVYKRLQDIQHMWDVVLDLKSWYRMLCVSSEEACHDVIDMLDHWLPRLLILQIQPGLSFITRPQERRKALKDSRTTWLSDEIMERVVALVEKHERRRENTSC